MRRLVRSQIHAGAWSPVSGQPQAYVVNHYQELGSHDTILTEQLMFRGDATECRKRYIDYQRQIYHLEAAEHVFSKWSGRHADHWATVARIEEDKFYVGYNTLRSYNSPAFVPTFGVQINVDRTKDYAVCYLLVILLPEGVRGKGLGSELYKLVVEFARAVRCDIVVQTPSGQTYTGEPRDEYLVRRGWSFNHGEAYIELTAGTARKYFEKVRM